MAKRQFLRLEDGGGDTDQGLVRSSIEPVGDVMWLDSLKDGRRAKKPPGTPRFRISPPLPCVEDMPWCGMAYVVSERFRKLLKEKAPGHAQFFKAEVTGPKKQVAMLAPALPYHVVNWLHVVDCIDMKKSEYDADDDGEGEYLFSRVVLDATRVPEDVLIFRLRQDETTTMIDAALAKKIRKAGITGPQFYNLNL